MAKNVCQIQSQILPNTFHVEKVRVRPFCLKTFTFHSIWPPNSGRDRKKLYLYARNASNSTQRLLFAGWLILGLPPHTHPEFDRKMLKSSPTRPQPPPMEPHPFSHAVKSSLPSVQIVGKSQKSAPANKRTKKHTNQPTSKGRGKTIFHPLFHVLAGLPFRLC